MLPPVTFMDDRLKEQIRFQNEQLHYSIYAPPSGPQFYGDIPWHWHKEFEFGYVTEGSLLYKTSHQEYVLKEGDAIFLNYGALHYIQLLVPAKKAKLCSQFFHRRFLGGEPGSAFDTRYIAPVIQQKQLHAIPFYHQDHNDQEVIRFLAEAMDIARRQPPFFEFALRNLFSNLWQTIYCRAAGQTSQQAYYNPGEEERIKQMITFVRKHFSQKLTVAQIAGCVPISERECYRVFQSCLDTTPAEFLMSVRLENARELLSATGKSIVEIALESGFNNSSYFGKMFRKQYQMSPGEYRKACYFPQIE